MPLPKTFCNYTNLLRLFPFPISLSASLSCLSLRLVLIYASGTRKNRHRLPTEYFNYASRVRKQLLVKPFLALARKQDRQMGASEISVELSPETNQAYLMRRRRNVSNVIPRPSWKLNPLSGFHR